MIYGDTVNQTDSLGLTNYAYRPNISAVMQSGNLYVYGINNPLTFTDYSGRAITLAVFATRFLIGVAIQAATDIIEYAYSDDPNKELFSSTPMEYIWAGVSNTFSFGFGNKIVNTIAESFVSSLGQEIIRANELALSGDKIQSPTEVWTAIAIGTMGEFIILPKNKGVLNEMFPETISRRANIVSNISPLYETVDVIDDMILIIPKAYKNNVVESVRTLIDDKLNKKSLMEM